MTNPIEEAILQAELRLSTRYYEWWVWDPMTRRRRISLRHIEHPENGTTRCGLSIPWASATLLNAEAVESGIFSTMVCRRCKANAGL
jgi:hypothetical protein